MSKARFDVTGIGNAIVDVLATADDEMLVREQLTKGSMTLIDEQRAHELYEKLGPAVERSGGSAGNTMAGLASLGGRGAYVGKVHKDSLGEAFTTDMRAGGIHFEVAPLEQGPSTARCLIIVTPDAQRTMNTYLGACVELGPGDIDEAVIQNSAVTYMEGYLWDPPQAKEAFLKACKIAHDSGNEVSLSLSDSFCVHRHRQEFRDLVEHHVDVLFANEEEMLALYESQDLSEAVSHVKGKCKVAAVTRSEKGALLITDEQQIEIAAEPVAHVVDTTGAGDLYAAGFLHGYTRDQELEHCGRLGALAAAEVISHFGARPDLPLKDWVAERI